MSPIVELNAPNAVRLATNTSPRVGASARSLTVQPSDTSRLVFQTEPAGLAVEQYKILRRRLCNLHPKGGLLLVTSPSPGEGKTLTSVNLGWCLAEAGQSTCLVDLDFRAPGMSKALGCAVDGDGVEDVLSGKRTADQALRQLGERPLHVLSVRRRHVSPGDLLSNALLDPFLTELRASFEWVILDFAPIIPMADVGEILPHVDGVLMVIRSGKTDKRMIPTCLEILGSKLWGVVVNDSPINGSAYYGTYGKQRD